MNQFDFTGTVPLETPGTATVPGPYTVTPAESVPAVPAEPAAPEPFDLGMFARWFESAHGRMQELEDRVTAAEEKLAGYEAMIAQAAESPMGRQVMAMLGIRPG